MKTTAPNKFGKDYTELATRMPAPVLNDLKHRLAPLYSGTLIGMYDLLVRTFFREAPWMHGLKWRETQTLSRQEENRTVATGVTSRRNPASRSRHISASVTGAEEGLERPC